MSRRHLVFVLLALTACAARSRAIAEASDPSLWQGDARLYRMLLAFPLGATQEDSLALYSQAHPDDMNERLAIAAEDTSAPSVVRANALLLLSRRSATQQLGSFRVALDDRDVRVRATAVAAMREFLEVRPAEALQIARTALQDSAAEVQAQALHIIGERDPTLLRAYLQRNPTRELAQVARDLLAVAEERGAPLAGDSLTGILRRTSTHGHTVTFTPVRRWPQSSAAYGDVAVAPAQAAPFTVQRIEVVGNVIPLFFSSDGERVVYERDRMIVMRELATGVERAVGQGIAPRVRPFTDDFLFLREVPADSRTEQRERTLIHYDVFRAPFRGDAELERIGSTTAATSFGVRGGYSAARWARVEEHGGQFYLVADGMETVTLPSPFTSGPAR